MDGTGNPQDALGVTPDPSTGKKGTSTQTPETFTKEMVDKAVNDALSKAGRDAKSFEAREQAIKSAEEKILQAQKQKDDEYLVSIQDNPDALKEYQAEQKRKAKATELTERERKANERDAEFADIIERDKIITRTQLAAEVAVEKGVSIDAILKLAKGDTREAYEAVAEVLPKTTQALLPDSSRTMGGGKMPESAKGKMQAGWGEIHK